MIDCDCCKVPFDEEFIKAFKLSKLGGQGVEVIYTKRLCLNCFDHSNGLYQYCEVKIGLMVQYGD